MFLRKWKILLMLFLFHHMHHSLSSELQHLIKVLESVPNSEAYVYQLRDDQQKTMDCLKVFQRAEGQHIGVSHSLQNGVFGIRLSCSDDLLNWTYVNTLDIHASQANIWPTENGAYLRPMRRMLQTLVGFDCDFMQILLLNTIFSGA